jgi:hypothetical protein
MPERVRVDAPLDPLLVGQAAQQVAQVALIQRATV